MGKFRRTHDKFEDFIDEMEGPDNTGEGAKLYAEKDQGNSLVHLVTSDGDALDIPLSEFEKMMDATFNRLCLVCQGKLRFLVVIGLKNELFVQCQRCKVRFMIYENDLCFVASGIDDGLDS